MELTKEFVLAVEQGADALRSKAHTLAHCDMAKDDTTAGRVVRTGAESSLQTADLLSGWAKRAREAVGMEPQP